ncbi:hypothetical protein [Psychrobacillus sp. NPDC093180]|uniref:hypothetical protein n=1 Tax=Psychrobacillus sp. NPDC093180 TaxID=3364489 RepID=UPI003820BE9C
MTKSRFLLKILSGVVLLVIGGYVCLSLLVVIQQGKYWKYDNGVTIEVINSTGKNIYDLEFTYGHSENSDFQEIGTIKKVESGKTSILARKNFKINKIDKDLSLYMHSLVNGEKVEQSLLYLDVPKPNKVVVLIEIVEVDNKGKMKLKVKGFDGLSEFKY